MVNRLRFFISEYEDGTLKVETKHMHYAFRDDLNYDDVDPKDLFKIISEITSICAEEDLSAVFEML